MTALALAALAVIVPMRGRTAVAATPRTNRRRPNILFVLADDLDLAELRALPHVHALVGTAGTTFDQYLVSNSLCCPSRTTTLRGQYAHNTGVWTNGGENGGFERAHANGVEQDTVATRLHHGGYTDLARGQVPERLPERGPPRRRAPGMGQLGQRGVRPPLLGVRLRAEPEPGVPRVPAPAADYGTDVYVGLTDRFIRGAGHAHRPFFAYLSVYTPHQPATPARAIAASSVTPGRRTPRASTRLT